MYNRWGSTVKVGQPLCDPFNLLARLQKASEARRFTYQVRSILGGFRLDETCQISLSKPRRD